MKSRLIGAITAVEAIGWPRCPRMNPTIPSARCSCGTYKLQVQAVDRFDFERHVIGQHIGHAAR